MEIINLGAADGLPPVPDFHGGDGNFRSVDYMAIPYPPMQTLATMIIDGVLDRFPELKVGVIEQGASWVPGWMRSMDSAATAFMRNEERLQRLSLKPSELVRRQVRVTPYPHEDAGWIVENAGEDVCLFSSDYPHVEGGRNPLGRFEASLGSLRSGSIRHGVRDDFGDRSTSDLGHVGCTALDFERNAHGDHQLGCSGRAAASELGRRNREARRGIGTGSRRAQRSHEMARDD